MVLPSVDLCAAIRSSPIIRSFVNDFFETGSCRFSSTCGPTENLTPTTATDDEMPAEIDFTNGQRGKDDCAGPLSNPAISQAKQAKVSFGPGLY